MVDQPCRTDGSISPRLFKGESEFAHRLENNENILLFTKLKKGGFVIDTPYGNYSPDWAVVCRRESLADASIGIYFTL